MDRFALNKDNISKFAYVNFDRIKGKINGIVIECHGMDCNGITDPLTEKIILSLAEKYAEQGIAFAFPYYDLWGWANEASIRYIDSVVYATEDYFGIGHGSAPFAISGGSMGGLIALNYSFRGCLSPCAISLNCPIGSIENFYNQGDYFARTIYSAFADKDNIEEAMAKVSPAKIAMKIPDVPMLIIYGDIDPVSTYDLHIKPLTEAIGLLGKKKEFLCIKGENMSHCDLTAAPGLIDIYSDFSIEKIKTAYSRK